MITISAHAEAIRPEIVAALVDLDPPFRTLAIASEFSQSIGDARALNAAARLLRSRRDQTDEHDLPRLQSAKEACAYLDGIYYSTPFPKPPVPDTQVCRALNTREMMLEAARRFQNCIRSFVPEVIRGEQYFYEWMGGEPAIVKLVPDQPYGWILAEWNGQNNCNISPCTLEEIKHHFASFNVEARQHLEHLVTHARMLSGRRRARNAEREEVEEFLDDLETEFDAAYPRALCGRTVL